MFIFIWFFFVQSKLISSASATTGRTSWTGSFSSIGAGITVVTDCGGAGAETCAGGGDIGIPFGII